MLRIMTLEFFLILNPVDKRAALEPTPRIDLLLPISMTEPQFWMVPLILMTALVVPATAFFNELQSETVTGVAFPPPVVPPFWVAKPKAWALAVAERAARMTLTETKIFILIR